MEEKQLKEVMERVRIKREMEEEILKNVTNNQLNGKQTNQRRGRKIVDWQKKAAVAVIALMTVGVAGVSVNAVRNSFVKQRMEEVPQEEIEQLVEEIDTAMAEADTYSRELSEEEEKRRSLLYSEYLNGKFPEQELMEVQKESQIEDKDILCVAVEKFYFNIPDRELTDEELLQLIDYEEKRNYALQERYKEEYAQEIAKQEAAEQEEKQKIEEKGGITEEEAVIKAQEWLLKLYGKTDEGLELNHYLMTDETGDAGENPSYMVCYSVRGDYYYFTILSQDGELVEASHTYDGFRRDEINASDAEAKVQTTYQLAENWLENKFGVLGEYEEVCYSYLKSGEKVYTNLMSFYFVKADGTCHKLTYLCDDDSFFRYLFIENYEEYLEQQKVSDEAMLSGPESEEMTEANGLASERVTGRVK